MKDDLKPMARLVAVGLGIFGIVAFVMSGLAIITALFGHNPDPQSLLFLGLITAVAGIGIIGTAVILYNATR